MAKCAACGSTILFGGVTQDGERFCNSSCQQQYLVAEVASQLPADLIEQALEETHQGDCPVCGGEGPVDVHTSHRAWSALIVTTWSSHPRVSCRSCAVKHNLLSTMFTGTFGWWGFPWGLIATPIQVTRNFVALFRGPDPSSPSPALRAHVMTDLALQVREHQRQKKRRQRPESDLD